MEPITLQVNHLRTSFFSERGEAKAVNDVSFVVPQRSIIGFVGESGSGKSMTARSIMRLVKYPGKITGGEIMLVGRELTALSERDMAKVRCEDVSMIFQEPMTSLNPVMRVGKQVQEAVLLHQKISKKEAKAQVVRMFERVGIPEPERRFDCYPHELSGGLRQRVMIAMAMMCRPKLLIADEPTTALDVTVEAQILNLMKSLRDETGASIILISHNLGVIAEVCDYIHVMYAGRIVEQAETFDLFDHPAHPYTVGLMKSVASLEQKPDRLDTIPGNVPALLNLPSGCSFAPRCAYCGEKCEARMPELHDIGGGHLVRCHRIEEESHG